MTQLDNLQRPTLRPPKGYLEFMNHMHAIENCPTNKALLKLVDYD